MKYKLKIENAEDTSGKINLKRLTKRAESVEEQIERQKRAHGYKNRLKEVIGQWPGYETFEELKKMLTK